MRGDVLNGCVFDHFMLEKESKAGSVNYTKLKSLFADAQLKFRMSFTILLDGYSCTFVSTAAVQAVSQAAMAYTQHFRRLPKH